MDNERTIVLINVGDMSVGLKDVQGRFYRLGKGGRIRISPIILQDILDYQPSKVIFKHKLVQIENITKEALYSMGLTEEEIAVFAPKAIDKIKEEDIVEEEDITKEEDITEEDVVAPKKEEKVVVKKVSKPKTTKKTGTKKTTKKAA